jgi:acyl-CoA thioester hydrolase
MTAIFPSYIENGAHHYALRVQFEDVDMTGVVHHPNYLRYCERARTDCFLHIGIDHRATMAEGRGYFVLAHAELHYKLPALYEDMLEIVTTISSFGSASINVQQRVMRGETLCTLAHLRIGFVSNKGRPQRQPQAWLDAYKTIHDTAIS